MLESESVAVAGGLQPGCNIDEEDRVAEATFLAEFSKERLGRCQRSRRKQPDMEQAIRGGIDSARRPTYRE
jgi:hypothetical protein